MSPLSSWLGVVQVLLPFVFASELRLMPAAACPATRKLGAEGTQKPHGHIRGMEPLALPAGNALVAQGAARSGASD